MLLRRSKQKYVLTMNGKEEKEEERIPFPMTQALP